MKSHKYKVDDVCMVIKNSRKDRHYFNRTHIVQIVAINEVYPPHIYEVRSIQKLGWTMREVELEYLDHVDTYEISEEELLKEKEYLEQSEIYYDEHDIDPWNGLQ